MTGDGGTRAHVLVLPYPSLPHILPMLELARQIARRKEIAITFVAYDTQLDRLRGHSDAINFVGVRDADPEHGFPSGFTSPLRNSFRLACNVEPFVEQLLRDRQRAGGVGDGPTCMLVDYLNWWSVDVAAKLGIPRYILCVISTVRVAAQLSWHEHGVEELPGGRIRLARIPSNIITEGWEFPVDDERKRTFSKWSKSIKESDGVLLNTWTELDSDLIESIRTMNFTSERINVWSHWAPPMLDVVFATADPQKTPVLAVGPLGVFPSTESKNVSVEGLALSDDGEITTWLNQQAPSSVLYIAFGTTGMRNLSKQHMLELAQGLERSRQRFIWALQAPPDVQDIDDALPPGFKERTSGRGLLLRGWAPQKLILSHLSTGGFLSSCGWNSAVESVSRGVPIIGWPSFADQPMVCRVMALKKLAIELPHHEHFFVKAVVIANAITVILVSEEGAAMRQRATQCQASIAAALASGGSSFHSMENFCKLIKSGPT